MSLTECGEWSRYQQGFVTSGSSGELNLVSLPFPALRSHLHFLAYGPFLCLQSQQDSIFKSLSWGPLFYPTHLFYLLFLKVISSSKVWACLPRSPLYCCPHKNRFSLKIFIANHYGGVNRNNKIIKWRALKGPGKLIKSEIESGWEGCLGGSVN